jgi:hypothetical protein
MTIMTKNLFTIAACSLVLVACAASSETDSTSTALTSPPEVVVDSLAAAGPQTEPRPIWNGRGVERDGRAARAFESIQARQRGTLRAVPLTLAIYELEAPMAANARAELRAQREFGFDSLRPTLEVDRRAASIGNNTFTMNTASGAERFVDVARFHRGTDTTPELAEDVMLRRASEYVDRIGLAASDGRSTLYPYKIRRYHTMVQGVDSANQVIGEPEDHIDQVAVAFAQEIDGLPVIGPGGKIAVHLTPSGDVVSYEASIRYTVRATRTLVDTDLLSADRAEADVRRRLIDRGIDLTQFTLTRTEFGYLRLGRSSIQTVLVPHYAFAFEPAAGTINRRLVETIPAVSDPDTLARLAVDAQAEAQRKAAIGHTEQDERPLP